MEEIVCSKLMQLKYLSAVSAFCLSCMVNIIFNELDMNNTKIANYVLSVCTIREEQKSFNTS